jgi:hypothetical protein
MTMGGGRLAVLPLALAAGVFLGGATSVFAQSDSVKFAEGQSALEKYNDCRAAIDAFRSVSPAGQQSAIWVYYMAKSYECALDYRNALAMYTRYDQMKPNQAEVIAKIGELRYLAARAERDAAANRVEREAREVRERSDREAREARERLERLYGELDRQARRFEYLERYADALAFYERTVAAHPGTKLRYADRIAETQAAVDKARKVLASPKDWRLSPDYERYHLGRYSEVVVAMTRLINEQSTFERDVVPRLKSQGVNVERDNSGLCESYRFRAMARHALGETARAVDDMQVALTHCERSEFKVFPSKAHFIFAAILYDGGRLPEALSHIDQALRRDQYREYIQLKDDIKTTMAVGR